MNDSVPGALPETARHNQAVPVVDSSVLTDRDCLVVLAAVVLCSDRGVQAHKTGYDYGGIAYLTAKGVAGRRG